MTEAPGEDPIELLNRWHAEAVTQGSRDPDAMALATATLSGEPSVRIVLFKGVVGGKIRFVTNYLSRKEREIAANPRVALAFYWPELYRQVRIEGRAEHASVAESDAYFATRPRESQLGAWASPQSQPIASRAVLEDAFGAAEARFLGRTVERPDHWGVTLVTPLRVELWVAARHRLHDRFLYERAGAGWSVTRLAP
jgi:pyridoxamine 5'-phosphate oxidase